MGENDKDKLLSKLLDFADIKQGAKGSFVYGYYKYPDDDNLQIAPPDLLNSLDACFKYLVRKAVIKIAERFQIDSRSAMKMLFGHWLKILFNSSIPTEYINDAPLALCLTIEKIADKDGLFNPDVPNPSEDV
jgi:hypothetical protein